MPYDATQTDYLSLKTYLDAINKFEETLNSYIQAWDDMEARDEVFSKGLYD
jgi:hypothetical protein